MIYSTHRLLVLHLGRRGGRGPAEDPSGPHSRPPRPIPPSPAWPMVSTRPSRRSPCGGDHRVRLALAEAPPKPAEAAIVTDLPASRGRRRAGLLMPASSTGGRGGAGPPSRQHGGADLVDLSVEGPALQERDAPQPPPRAPAARQGRRTASRCAACDRQERAMKERHGSSWTTI